MNPIQKALEFADGSICRHEDLRRGGYLWTICESCGAKWADDQGGFKPSQWPEIYDAAVDYIQKEQTELTGFFRSEDGHAFGVEGDHRGWTAEQTAIHFLRILAADSNVRFLKKNIDEARIQINRQIDDMQRRLNNINTGNLDEPETR